MFRGILTAMFLCAVSWLVLLCLQTIGAPVVLGPGSIAAMVLLVAIARLLSRP